MRNRLLVAVALAAIVVPAGASAAEISGISFGTRLLVNTATVQVGDNAAIVLNDDASNDIFAFETDQIGDDKYAATVDVEVNLPDGGFYFAHNLVGCGKTKSSAETVLAIDIKNDTTSTQTGTFVSKILTGHAAVRNTPGNDAKTSYFFGIYLDNTAFPGFQGFSTVEVEGADEDNIDQSLKPAFAFQGGGLNNYTVFAPDASITATDWGETNLGLELTLAAGQTRTIFYALSSSQEQDGPCLDGRTCQASQVLFADPRDTGGVDSITVNSAVPSSVEDGPDLPLDYCTDVGRDTPIVGQRRADPTTVLFSFVDGDVPPNPPFLPPSYEIDVVPAPAMFVLFGIGALALGIRRRG